MSKKYFLSPSVNYTSPPLYTDTIPTSVHYTLPPVHYTVLTLNIILSLPLCISNSSKLPNLS